MYLCPGVSVEYFGDEPREPLCLTEEQGESKPCDNRKLHPAPDPPRISWCRKPKDKRHKSSSGKADLKRKNFRMSYTSSTSVCYKPATGTQRSG